jgi:hypothetical protein
LILQQDSFILCFKSILTCSHKMLNAIHEFEQVCRDHGVIPQLYHSNNASVFTSEGMAEKLKRFAQIIMFAGTDSELVTFHHKFHHSRNNIHHSLGPVALN